MIGRQLRHIGTSDTLGLCEEHLNLSIFQLQTSKLIFMAVKGSKMNMIKDSTILVCSLFRKDKDFLFFFLIYL